MTYSYFDENITTWDDLIHFCIEEGLDVCDDVYSFEAMSDYINDYIVRNVDAFGWADIADALNEIPRGYDFYNHCGGLDFNSLDDYTDFDSYRDQVIYTMDGCWDDEELFIDEIGNDECEKFCEAPDEPIALADLFLAANKICIKANELA